MSIKNKAKFTAAFGMMVADGKISDHEKELIVALASKYGISQSDFHEIVNNPGKFTDPSLLPTEQAEKEEFLYEMVLMAVVDGDLHDDEKQFIVAIASVMGLSEGDFKKVMGRVFDN